LQALKDDEVATLHQAALLIKEITGVSYCDSAVWFVFKRLDIKKKTGRPQNVRKDTASAESFKKKHRH
jgi:transposase